MLCEIRIFNFCWDKFVLAYKITCCNISFMSVLERNEKRKHVTVVSIPRESVILKGEGGGVPDL